MNDLTTSAGISRKLAANGLAYNRAREDAALFERLKGASSLAARLAKEGEALTAKLSEVSAAEDAAKRDALFAQFGGMTVTYQMPPDRSGLLNAKWAIRWKKNVQTGYAWSSGMKDFDASDFTTLEHSYPDAYRYLVEAHPEKIPDIIMELSPNNPAEAMAIYCASKRANRIIMPSRTNA